MTKTDEYAHTFSQDPIRGQTDRFETSEEWIKYLLRFGDKIVGGIVALLFVLYYLRSEYGIGPTVLTGVMIGLAVLATFSWWFHHWKYSKPGFIEITDDKILRNVKGVETLFKFSNLRDVELPSQKEYGYGDDYIYLYFGDGESLELERWLPHFADIKHAIMRRIAMHPDLHFLRVRLSKSAAA